MTQTLANRVTTDPNQVFVACNPLQPQEEMLALDQMAETRGGITIPPIPPPVAAVAAVVAYKFVLPVAVLVTAGYIIYELTSEEADNSCCSCCNSGCCDCGN